MKGVNINIKVSGYVKNYVGRPASISSVLPGEGLPEVPTQSVDNKLLLLQWSPPVDYKENNITYGIYYGTTMIELNESAYTVCPLVSYFF